MLSLPSQPEPKACYVIFNAHPFVFALLSSNNPIITILNQHKRRKCGETNHCFAPHHDSGLQENPSLALAPNPSTPRSAMTIHTDTHPPPPTIPTPSNFVHHHHHHGLRWVALFLLLSPATAQLSNTVPQSPPPPDPFSRLRFDRNMAIIMVVLVVVFFILGFLSVYTRQCAEQRLRGRLDLTLPMGVSGRRPRGLEPEIIDAFPTFVYSGVKGLKMGASALECAVCLNEFQDDETLRLIPKCSHVFHPHCIDIWLSSHSTCPLCRANLIPRPGETSFVAVQIPSPSVQSPEPDPRPEPREEDNRNRNRVEAECGNGSRSLIGRSHSTGHSLEVEGGENWERFTLRLPEEARKQLVNRTNSCVTLRRERSERRGYRTRSVESYLQDEGRPERWGFTMRPPFFGRTASNRAPLGPSAVAMDNVGERSSDPLFTGNKD